MKKLKSIKTFEKNPPIGIAGVNRLFRQDEITFEPVENFFAEGLIGQIQNSCRLVLQSLKALCL